MSTRNEGNREKGKRKIGEKNADRRGGDNPENEKGKIQESKKRTGGIELSF